MEDRMDTSDPVTPGSTVSGDVITAQHLRFAYGRRPVFAGLDLKIPRGSVYGLLGPNSCGKSTLFRLLLGQSLASGGELKMLDLDPGEHWLGLRYRVGYVPQVCDLPGYATVDEVLARFQSIYEQRWNGDLAARLLERLELAHWMGYKIDSLSGGLKQRLALTVAVAIEPEILLLDEPSSGLDAVVRRQFTETVIEFMAEDPGRTVVLSSHLLSELEPLVDHVGIVAPGPKGSHMLIESSLTELKDNVRIAELGRRRIPEQLEGHPGLLCSAGDEAGTLVFWVAEHSYSALARQIEAAGGHMVDRAGLNEMFVRLFRGTEIGRRATVQDGRLQAD